jgi:hypothetical protein
MSARLITAILATVVYFSVQAAPQWVALAGGNADATFVNRASISEAGQYVDVQVLRDLAETVTLGTDPKTGETLYPHRSVTLTYKVDCAAERLAMSEWQMYAGNFGQGKVIWDQKNMSGLAFIPAVDPEMRAVLRTACATTTVAR